MYIYTHTYVYMYMYVYIYIYMCVCVCLITKQRAVKKKMRLYFSIKTTRTKWFQSILKTMFKYLLTQMT